MTDSVVIELLVLGLLLTVNARLFFVRRGQQDGVVVLSPVALFICILGYLAWDITLLNAMIFILALFVFLENVHGVWRFCSKLYVDYFSPLLWLCSVVNIILVLVLGALVVIFRPVPDSSNLQVAERYVALAGSVHSGLMPRTGMLDPVEVLLIQFKPESDTALWTERGSRLPSVAGMEVETSSLPLVLWVTDGRTTASRVRPVAAQLASLGYEVVVADFNQDIAGSFVSRVKGIFFLEEFQKEIPTWSRESSFQYGALIDYFGGRRGLQDRTVLLLGDGYTGNGMEAALLLHDFVAGGHAINGDASSEEAVALPGWLEGFGPVGETAPWLSYVIGHTEFMHSRDTDHFYSIAAAQQSHKVFELILSRDETEPPQETVAVAEAIAPSRNYN